MIKRKPLFALVALAGIALSSGAAYVAVSMTSASASPTSSSHAAVDLADIEQNPAMSVFLEADLSGRSEYTKYSKTAGDPNGRAVVILRISRNQIIFEITTTGMSSTSSAVNLQLGNADETGPAQMNLMPNAMPATINSVLGVINVRTSTGFMNRMLNNPSSIYANILTPSYRHGAARGQFRRIGPVDFFRILHVGNLISVNSGDQVVETMGDMNAHATVFVAATNRMINYAALWTGATSPTALTINQGAIGAVGNQVATLFNVRGGLNPTIIAVAGTVWNVPMNVVQALNTAPMAFHTNLITGRFPNGAVRGQLFAATAMTTTTPPTTSTTMPTSTVKPTTSMMPTTPTMPMNPTMNPTATGGAGPTTAPATHW